MQQFLQHWLNQILYGIPNLLTALLIFVVSLYAARLVMSLLRGFLQRRRMAPHMVDLLAHILYWSILLIGVIMTLQRFFDVTAFLAGLGIIGFTVGFALQDVMKNFAAGIILVLQQPFRVGEAISVAGFEGTILAIDLRATEMSTFDGRLVSIPNATILTNPIINYTRAPRRRVDITIPVASSEDLAGVRRVVLNAMQNAPGVVSDPAPMVGVEQITATSANLTGQFWVDISKSNPDVSRDAALTRIRNDLAQSPAPAGAAGDPSPLGSGIQQSD
jgi:small conductance mechanosensitive channel